MKIIPCTTGHRVAAASFNLLDVAVSYRHVAAWIVSEGELHPWEVSYHVHLIPLAAGGELVTGQEGTWRLLEPGEELSSEEAQRQAEHGLRRRLEAELERGPQSIEDLERRFEPMAFKGLVLKLVELLVGLGRVVVSSDGKYELVQPDMAELAA